MKPVNVLSFLIRMVLSVALLFGVYRETGKWTVLCMALGMFANEMAALSLRTLRKDLK